MSELKKAKRPFEFLIEDVFNVKGVGTVISGFVNTGAYQKGDQLYVGPMKDGTYATATVRSIHVSQTLVDYTFAGHSACFAISGLTKSQRRCLSKGLAALTKLPEPPTVRVFRAEIVMLRGEPVTATKGIYRTTAHILHLKQPVKLIDIQNKTHAGGGLGHRAASRGDSALLLRPGDQACATFKFLNGGAVSVSLCVFCIFVFFARACGALALSLKVATNSQTPMFRNCRHAVYSKGYASNIA